MKRRLALLGAVAAVAGTMTLFSSTSPAQAIPHDVCVEVFGSATTSSPLTYPVIGQTDGNTAPPLQVTASPHSAWFTVHFTTGLCVPSLTQLSASGVVHGWCGLSVGTGATSFGHDFHWVGIGGILVITGEAVGVANVEPNILAGESCITGADNFLVTYAGVHSSCSVASINSLGVSVNLPNFSVTTGIVDAHIHGSIHPRVSACV